LRKIFYSVLFLIALHSSPILAQEFIEREITFRTDDTLTLYGTLTLPVTPLKGSRKPPIVIFVHGSGPQTRDEATVVIRYDSSFRNTSYDWKKFAIEGLNIEIGRMAVLKGLLKRDAVSYHDVARYVRYTDTSFVFRDIAHGLAKAGIASLRFDKRSYTYGKVLLAQGKQAAAAALGSLDDYVRDTRAAIRFVRTLAEVNSGSIFLLGHSEGASGIIQLAAIQERERGIRGLILLAPSAVGIDSTIRQQLRGSYYFLQIDTLLRDIRLNTPNSDGIWVLNASGTYWKSWMRITDSVAEFTERTHVPILMIHGTLDITINSGNSTQLSRKILTRSPKRSVTLRIINGLDHYLRLPWETVVDSRVQNEMARWIATKSKNSPQ
jgi:alpha-beta hydrolase superfamily lysophospholipase